MSADTSSMSVNREPKEILLPAVVSVIVLAAVVAAWWYGTYYLASMYFGDHPELAGGATLTLQPEQCGDNATTSCKRHGTIRQFPDGHIEVAFGHEGILGGPIGQEVNWVSLKRVGATDWRFDAGEPGSDLRSLRWVFGALILLPLGLAVFRGFRTSLDND